MEWINYSCNIPQRKIFLFKENINTRKGNEKKIHIDKIHEYLQKDKNALEVYNGGLIKLFIDIDIKYENYKDINFLLEKRKKLINKYLNDKWFIVDFSRKIKNTIKLSFHLIHKNITFKNCKDLKNYVKQFYNDYEGIDYGIYKKYFCLRAPNQTKWNENIPLKCTFFGPKKIEKYLINHIGNEIYEKIDLTPIFDKNKKINFKTKYNKNMLSELLNILTSDYYDNYDLWLKICFSLKSLNDDNLIKLFNNFSKKSAKYKGFSNIKKQWLAIKNNTKNKITINTLFWLAKKCNEKLFNKIIEKYNTKLLEDRGLYFQDFVNKWNGQQLIDSEEFIKDLRSVVGFYNNGNRIIYIFKNSDGIEMAKDRKALQHYYIRDKNNKKIRFDNFLMNYGYHKIQFNRIIFRPNYYEEKTFNMFPGFKSEKINNFNKKLIGNILNHIKIVLANNNNDNYYYILNWLSKLVKEPEIKNGVVLVFIGKQGCGKSIFGRFLREMIIGISISAEVADLTKVTGRFNTILQNKLLITLDEVSNVEKNYHRTFDILKNLITEDKRIIEKKGIDPISVDDYCNYIMFSNNYFPVRIEGGDRRYCVLECGDKYIKNKTYFDNLRDDFENKNIANHFYTFLLSRDIAKVNLEKMPFSKLKLELLERSLPKIIWFIKDILVDKEILISKNDLWEKYSNYCIFNNIKRNKSKNSFFKDIKKYIEEKRIRVFDNGKRDRYYKINPDEFKKKVYKYHNYKIIF
jgi:hypothetical protein